MNDDAEAAHRGDPDLMNVNDADAQRHRGGPNVNLATRLVMAHSNARNVASLGAASRNTRSDFVEAKRPVVLRALLASGTLLRVQAELPSLLPTLRLLRPEQERDLVEVAVRRLAPTEEESGRIARLWVHGDDGPHLRTMAYLGAQFDVRRRILVHLTDHLDRLRAVEQPGAAPRWTGGELSALLEPYLETILCAINRVGGAEQVGAALPSLLPSLRLLRPDQERRIVTAAAGRLTIHSPQFEAGKRVLDCVAEYLDGLRAVELPGAAPRWTGGPGVGAPALLRAILVAEQNMGRRRGGAIPLADGAGAGDDAVEGAGAGQNGGRRAATRRHGAARRRRCDSRRS